MRWPFGRKQKVEERSLASPEAWLIELFGSVPTVSGETVTAETAMKVPAFRCAVLLLSDLCGALPLKLYKKDKDGSREEATDHPAYRLVHGFSSAWMPAAEMRRQMTYNALLAADGAAYAPVTRVRGELREILPAQSGAVTRKVDQTSGEPSYEVRLAGGGSVVMSWREVLEFRPYLGRSLLNDAREALGLSQVMERHSGAVFRNGGRPSGVLAFDGELTPAELTNRLALWKATHGGDRQGGTAAFDRGAKYHPVSLSSVDNQLIEARKHQIEEIARAARVPPIFLMEYGRATWSNSAEMGRVFLVYTLAPLLDAWVGSYSRTILNEEERSEFYFEFQTAALTEADIRTRLEALFKAVGGPWMTPNEARSTENRPRIDGGDALLRPAGVTASADQTKDEPA